MIANVLLMLAWAAFQNNFRPLSLLVGWCLGYVALAILANRGFLPSQRYVRRVGRGAAFLGFYLLELVLSNFRVAADVLGPRRRWRPAIVVVPLEGATDTEAEVTVLANLITLTPGTLSMDVSADGHRLLVHTMSLPNGDMERFRRELKHEFERRVLEVMK